MLSNFRPRWIIAVLGLSGVLAAACASGAPSPSTTAPIPIATAASAPRAAGPVATKPPANPIDPIKLRFGGAVTPPAMVHLAPYLAKSMGFFDEVGVDVDIVSFEGGIGALRATSSGLDIVATSSDPVFAGLQNGLKVKVIGTYAPRLSVVMISAKDIKSVPGLKGRKVGIQEAGGFAHVMAQLVLRQGDLSIDDVQWINVSTSDRLSSLISGQTDATVLHIDQYYAAVAANPEFSVLAKLWEVEPDWWYSAFVATDEAIGNKREGLVRFMTAIIKAQRFMYSNPVETKRIAVEATKRKPEEVDKAYDDLVKGAIWSVNDGMPRASIEQTIQKEIALGVVKSANPPTYDQLVDRSMVDEAIKRNGGPWTDDPRWY